MKLIVQDVAKRANITYPKELADKTGLPYASVYRIWNGTATRIDLKTLDKLCDVLRVPPGQLFQHEYND